MSYTNQELAQMFYDELCRVKISEMAEYPPTMGLGFPDTVGYTCKYCNEQLEGSERMARQNAKDVKCPCCNGLLWDANGKNRLRRSAFLVGHFDIERKKRYLKHLKQCAKRKDNIKNK